MARMSSCRAHPERFVNKWPALLPMPEAVWINPPTPSPDAHEKELPKTVGSQKPNAPRLILADDLTRWLETVVRRELAPTAHQRYEQVVSERLGHASIEREHAEHLLPPMQKAVADKLETLFG